MWLNLAQSNHSLMDIQLKGLEDQIPPVCAKAAFKMKAIGLIISMCSSYSSAVLLLNYSAIDNWGFLCI